MRHLLLMLPLLACSSGYAISMPTNELPHPTQVVCILPIEEQPEFPGGDKAMSNFLAYHLRYPKAAVKQQLQGRVYCHFVVNTNGSRSNVGVLKGVGYGCDEEAVRLIRLMPKWKPGKQSGKSVRVGYNLPINFLLADRQKVVTSSKPLHE